VLRSEEDEESDGVASNQSAEDGSVNENANNYSNNGSTGTSLMPRGRSVKRSAFLPGMSYCLIV